MTFDPLPAKDAHAALRKTTVAELKHGGMTNAPLCVSVAYDW